MPIINRLSAGVIVARRHKNAWQFLILRAYRNWDFPKGLVEPNENPLQTAIRETKEETSIQNLNFLWGTDYFETPPYNNGKVARFYLAVTTQESVTLPINPQLKHPEHHEYRWAGADEAISLLPQRLKLVLESALLKMNEKDSAQPQN
jgi:8-oxo-dGTP pyrophosphatase MutT (NUDIX family)